MKQMSKYQEALDLLKCNSEQYIANNSIGIKMERRFNESDEANKSLQELVDKATPKKPKVISKPYGNLIFEEYRCPVCNAQMGRNDCCSNNECRQAIDWIPMLSEVEIGFNNWADKVPYKEDSYVE